MDGRFSPMVIGEWQVFPHSGRRVVSYSCGCCTYVFPSCPGLVGLSPQWQVILEEVVLFKSISRFNSYPWMIPDKFSSLHRWQKVFDKFFVCDSTIMLHIIMILFIFKLQTKHSSGPISQMCVFSVSNVHQSFSNFAQFIYVFQALVI